MTLSFCLIKTGFLNKNDLSLKSQTIVYNCDLIRYSPKMPANFVRCENSPHHKTFTVKPNGSTLIHICKNTSTGKTYRGEVHHLQNGHMVGRGKAHAVRPAAPHKTMNHTTISRKRK